MVNLRLLVCLIIPIFSLSLWLLFLCPSVRFNSWGVSPYSTPPTRSLLNLMNAVSDRRLRVSRLERQTARGPTSLWMAFPSSEEVVEGANWYEQLWSKHDFGGVQYIEEMLSVAPCHGREIFVQIGAHLGIFPLFAAHRGCRAIAVEGMPAATNFTKISAILNGWDEAKFVAINAAVSDQNGHVFFDPKQIQIVMPRENDPNQSRLIRVPMVTFDTIDRQYGRDALTGESHIRHVVIDVEGYEQEVLLGAKELIASRSVRVFEIEVWTSHRKKGNVTTFPGLQLLVDHGYHLYSLVRNEELGYKPCENLSIRLKDLPRLSEKSCRERKLPDGICLQEIYALRSDVLPLNRWSSQCPK